MSAVAEAQGGALAADVLDAAAPYLLAAKHRYDPVGIFSAVAALT